MSGGRAATQMGRCSWGQAPGQTLTTLFYSYLCTRDGKHSVLASNQTTDSSHFQCWHRTIWHLKKRIMKIQRKLLIYSWHTYIQCCIITQVYTVKQGWYSKPTIRWSPQCHHFTDFSQHLMTNPESHPAEVLIIKKILQSLPFHVKLQIIIAMSNTK